MNVYGELTRAQLENLTADPSLAAVSAGRTWYRTDLSTIKIDLGGSSDTLAMLAAAQAITNKDYQGGTASNTSRLTLPGAATVTLSALTRKAGTLLWDTTLKVAKYDDGTNLNAIQAVVIPNYYSGYMSAINTSTTSTSYADGTQGGTNTLTSRVSNGLTVAASAANASVGITWTPSSANAVYLVTCSINCRQNTNAKASYFQLTDGSIVVAVGGINNSNSAGIATNVIMSGLYVPATASAVTLKVQLKSDSGGTALIEALSSDTAVEWTILQLAL